MQKSFHSILLLTLLIIFLALPAIGETVTAGKVMVVLDASGSMWEEINGEAKIVIARRMIHDMMRDWAPNIQLGLAAYGHRRKGDCQDIEVLVPLGKGTEKPENGRFTASWPISNTCGPRSSFRLPRVRNF